MGASQVASIASGARSTAPRASRASRPAGHLLRGREMKYSGVLEWGSKRSSKPANRIAKLSSFLLEAFGLTSDLCLRILSPKLPYRSVLTLHSPIG